MRDGDALPSSVTIVQGDNLTISVPKIYSFYPIGNVLNINLRQGSSPQTFVTLTEETSATELLIDTTGLASGKYAITLESFDTNNTV